MNSEIKRWSVKKYEPLSRELEDELRKFFSSRTEIANKLGVSKQFIGQWMNGYTSLPLIYFMKLEQLTNGAIPWTKFLREEDKCYLNLT